MNKKIEMPVLKMNFNWLTRTDPARPDRPKKGPEIDSFPGDLSKNVKFQKCSMKLLVFSCKSSQNTLKFYQTFWDYSSINKSDPENGSFARQGGILMGSKWKENREPWKENREPWKEMGRK